MQSKFDQCCLRFANKVARLFKERPAPPMVCHMTEDELRKILQESRQPLLNRIDQIESNLETALNDISAVVGHQSLDGLQAKSDRLAHEIIANFLAENDRDELEALDKGLDHKWRPVPEKPKTP